MWERRVMGSHKVIGPPEIVGGRGRKWCQVM